MRRLHREVRDQEHRGGRRPAVPARRRATSSNCGCGRTSRGWCAAPGTWRVSRICARCGCGGGRTRSGSAGTASPRAAATRPRSPRCAGRATSTQLARAHGGERRDPWGRPMSEGACRAAALGVHRHRLPHARGRLARRDGRRARARAAPRSRARSCAAGRAAGERRESTRCGRYGMTQTRCAGAYMTAREVAERLGLSPDTILRYYREGRIPGRRMPGTIRPVRFLWSEVEAAWDVAAGAAERSRIGGCGVTRSARTDLPQPSGLWAIRYRDAQGGGRSGRASGQRGRRERCSRRSCGASGSARCIGRR